MINARFFLCKIQLMQVFIVSRFSICKIVDADTFVKTRQVKISRHYLSENNNIFKFIIKPVLFFLLSLFVFALICTLFTLICTFLYINSMLLRLYLNRHIPYYYGFLFQICTYPISCSKTSVVTTPYNV